MPTHANGKNITDWIVTVEVTQYVEVRAGTREVAMKKAAREVPGGIGRTVRVLEAEQA